MKDDLISRRFLIEAFKDEFYAMYSDDFNYMIKWFENLPAADSSEFCDQLWEIAYEHGKRDAQPSVTMNLKVDRESFRKALAEAELTLIPAAEIVHCRDCRWWVASDTCGHVDAMVTAPEIGFCSYAERRTDG